MCHVVHALDTAASASGHHRGDICIATRATWSHSTGDGATDDAAAGTTSIRHTTIATSTTHFPSITST